MTDDELVTLVDKELHQSVGYFSGELSEQRRKSIQYYYGQPFGNEIEGRSTYVSHDVANTVEGIMPSLMRIFTASDEIVRFEPQGPEDEQAAQQATDYVNYVLMRQNNGFSLLYCLFKDALMVKNCFSKSYWEDYEDRKVETYAGLSPDELIMLVTNYQNMGFEVEVKEYDQETGTVKFEILKTGGKICVDACPPEEIFVNRGASHDLQKARFVAHRCKKSLSDLKQMGYPVDDIKGNDDDGDFDLEAIERRNFDEDGLYMRDERDDATREVWIVEAYIRVDFDGDGISELRKVTKVGKTLLDNEEIDRIPLATGTPIIMPHKLYGMSLSDLVMDLQLLKSTVARQVLDNMYLTNNSRMMALDGMVNIDDLLTVRPGGVVRVKTFDAVKPLQAPPLGAPAFQLLEYVDAALENRTGVTRYNQGLDADSLNKTATGIQNIMSASQQRIELIARILADTVVKDIAWGILHLASKHHTKPQVMRLNNNWIAVDPREWSNKFDMTVTVGLGTGNQDQLMASAQALMNIQKEIAMAGMGGRVVTEQNVYEAAIDFARVVNPKKADRYFTDPSKLPPPQPQVDPEVEIKRFKAETSAQQKAEAQELAREKQTADTIIQAKTLEQSAKDQELRATETLLKVKDERQKQEHDQAMAQFKAIQEMQKAEDEQKKRYFELEQKVLDLVKQNNELAAQKQDMEHKQREHEMSMRESAQKQENEKKEQKEDGMSKLIAELVAELKRPKTFSKSGGKVTIQ